MAEEGGAQSINSDDASVLYSLLCSVKGLSLVSSTEYVVIPAEDEQ